MRWPRLATFLLTPPLFYWLMPVFAGLVLAIPLAVWTSSEQWGLWLRRLGLLRIVEEAAPPPVLQRLDRLLAAAGPATNDRFVWPCSIQGSTPCT